MVLAYAYVDSSVKMAYKIKPNLEFILGDILNNKMKISDWSELTILINKAKNKIINSEKIIGPFSFLSLSDDLMLQKKVSEIYSNFYHPQNSILPFLFLQILTVVSWGY